jgi:hypothetical protein
VNEHEDPKLSSIMFVVLRRLTSTKSPSLRSSSDRSAPATTSSFHDDELTMQQQQLSSITEAQRGTEEEQQGTEAGVRQNSRHQARQFGSPQISTDSAYQELSNASMVEGQGQFSGLFLFFPFDFF